MIDKLTVEIISAVIAFYGLAFGLGLLCNKWLTKWINKTERNDNEND